MDLSDCSSLTSVVVPGDAFYFQVDDTDFEADAFQKSPISYIRLFKNKDNQFLILVKDQLLFQPTMQQSEADDSSAQFTIQTYSEIPQKKRGIPIAMITKKDKKVVCCSETGEIHADTLVPLPDQIGDGGHKALFFLRCVNDNSEIYKVEPSLCPSRYLGFEADAQNHSMNRLVLRPKLDQVDECTHFNLKRKV